MITFAYFIGIYGYLLFFLGIASLLYGWVVILLTVALCGGLIIKYHHKLAASLFSWKGMHHDPLSLFLTILVLFQVFINLLGALGPEFAFDALWYHLTFPKLYLSHHAIYHIPGGLFYYSDMPKFGEMLYVGGMAFGNEVVAKLIHFSFGILTSVALYKLSRKFFTPFISLLAVVIFYSNLVVDWESITAYIDLIRTFFEVMALWSFVHWYGSQRRKWLVSMGIMTGLAIATKVLAIGSFVIFLILLTSVFVMKKESPKKYLFDVFIYLVCALSVPLPWFIFSYIHTGTPFYPFFTSVYPIIPSQFSLNGFFYALWSLFIHSSDPLSPLYLLFFPLFFVTFLKFRKELKLIVWYSAVSLIIWYFTPQTGGGRFIVAYLPAFSLVCAAIMHTLEKSKLANFLVVLIILISMISIGYRFVANIKYIPVLLGQESKQVFLTKHLNFSYGDFYDTDDYLKTHILSTDTVLLYGFHNLYYVDFPFVDSSWVKKGDAFTYIAVQNTHLPARFQDWQLIYKNDKTMVQLYKPPKGKCLSTCYY